MTVSEIDFLKKLLSAQQGRIHALLELTKAVNSNFSKVALIKLFEFILIDKFNVNKYALFVHDEEWKIDLNVGDEEVVSRINVASDLLKFEVIQDVSRYPTDLYKGFDYIIPIVHKNIPLAYLLVGDIEYGGFETIDENLKFLETIANFIIVSLENKRLFKNQLEQERIGKELELASQVQNMLIPSHLPKNEFLDVGAFYKPHGGIGGDYYDFISIDDANVAFCICDVSGKGISAGMLMANFQAQLRSLVNKYNSLEQLIDHLNHKLFEITKGERYITMFLALYNFTNRKLRYVNAGHNPTLLHQQGEIFLLDKGCTILGAFDSIPRITPEEITLEDDALIFCYTDGLTELENDMGNQFGSENLHTFLFHNAHLPVDTLIGNLKNEMNDFKGERGYNDDVSVLVSRFF